MDVAPALIRDPEKCACLRSLLLGVGRPRPYGSGNTATRGPERSPIYDSNVKVMLYVSNCTPPRCQRKSTTRPCHWIGHYIRQRHGAGEYVGGSAWYRLQDHLRCCSLSSRSRSCLNSDFNSLSTSAVIPLA